ncbi:MAG: hypothetical protein K2X93_00940 [Candidatus Obscuribacterales bacterium]|nr:hypothetical protein [Candidatus Obscuribacterales bacterium]
MSYNRTEWSTTKSYQTREKKASPFIVVASLATIAGAGILTYNWLQPQKATEEKKEGRTTASTATPTTYHSSGGFHFWNFGSGSSATPAPSRFASSATKVSSYSAPAHTSTISRGFFGGFGGGHFSSFGG